ncbi:MAG TPA: hypothetical protein VHC71_01135 [Hyphomicrobium sp.]|nr:hypothetical protein [Hyphomicrobium sp.]
MLVSMAKMTGRFGVVLVGLWAGLATASAQQTPAPPAAAAEGSAAPNAAAPQDDIKQIKLTDEQVKHFIAAQADLAAVASKIQAAGDTPDPALQAELEGIATKNGFGNFAEFDDVAANISIVMAGLDSNTGNFVDPVEALKKERDDVQKDSSIPDADKKQLMDELTEAISTTPKLEYKENIEIVKAHKAEIEKALQ